MPVRCWLRYPSCSTAAPPVRWVNASLICGNPVLVTADRAVVVDFKMILK